MRETAPASMGIDARSSELQSILGSTRATDRAGKGVDTETSILKVLASLHDLRKRNGTLYVVGNGGSAAVASHSVTDFVNVGRLRATTIHDSSLMTCMANDFGYENAFARILGTLSLKGDILIAISSSGKSANILNAAATARERGCLVVTLSGFQAENPLRSLGDFNFWLDSKDYGMVEIGHQFVLHNIADRLRLGLGAP